jgi:hypothetical protein
VVLEGERRKSLPPSRSPALAGVTVPASRRRSSAHRERYLAAIGQAAGSACERPTRLRALRSRLLHVVKQAVRQQRIGAAHTEYTTREAAIAAIDLAGRTLACLYGAVAGGVAWAMALKAGYQMVTQVFLAAVAGVAIAAATFPADRLDAEGPALASAKWETPRKRQWLFRLRAARKLRELQPPPSPHRIERVATCVSRTCAHMQHSLEACVFEAGLWLRSCNCGASLAFHVAVGLQLIMCASAYFEFESTIASPPARPMALGLGVFVGLVPLIDTVPALPAGIARRIT